MISINTNASAMVALDTLRGINSDLQTLNDQISTGKKVSNARDNAAIWSISTVMESDVSSFAAVTESLSLGSATVGVARSAAEQITNLLTEAKDLIASAQDKTDADKVKIQTDLDNIEAQIGDLSDAASFNGVNLLQGGGFIEVLSSFNRDDTGVEAARINVNRVDLSVGTGTFGNGAALTSGALTSAGGATTGTGPFTAADAISDGETETLTFAAQVINTGDSFQLDLALTGGTETISYVAREGDTANDVVLGLRQQLLGVDGIDVTVETSSNPTQNNVSLSITNQTGADYTTNTVLTTAAQGTSTGSTGGLALFGGIDVTADAAQALTDIDTLIEYAIDAAASFGSAQKRLDVQSEFVTSLMDSLELGISALTDADLSAASAELSALQVQQQLGLQSLAIANQTPQTILSLFG